MNAARIQELAQFIPDSSDYFRYSLSSFGVNSTLHQNKVDRFLVAYRDLSFGYHFIRALISSSKELPPDVYEQELIDFYWFERTGETSSHLIEVLAIHHPSAYFLENSIQAMLLTEAPLDEISKTIGIRREVLYTYEKLFFNVRDRREESLLIANVVYPEHRLVETMEGYIKDVDIGSFLKRSAYNNGIDDVAYFIGLKVESIADGHTSNAQEMANRLESSIMANGYYLARNGFLNQRASHGVGAARGLIMAAKQGGEDTSEQDTYGASSIGTGLVEELQAIKGGEMRDRIEKQQSQLEADILSEEDAAAIADEE